MDFNSSELNPTLVAAEAFNSIVQQIQCSNLNFLIQLSPFAANISLKKIPLKDKTGIPFPLKNNKICSIIPPCPDSDEVAALTVCIVCIGGEIHIPPYKSRQYSFLLLKFHMLEKNS